MIDATADEVGAFAETLPGGFKEWRVELKEFTKTIQAGTLQISSDGNVQMEAWYGPHYLNTSNCPKFHAKFKNTFSSIQYRDPGTDNQIDLSYKWSCPDNEQDKLPAIQEKMLDVIRCFFPKLKPEPGKPIYAEYGVRPDNSIYFIEVNDSLLLADGIEAPPPATDYQESSSSETYREELFPNKKVALEASSVDDDKDKLPERKRGVVDGD